MAILDFFKRFSAKTYLVGAFTIVATTPVIMLSVIQYNFIDNNILSVMENNNLNVVRSVAEKINFYINSSLRSTSFISNQIIDRDENEIKDIFKRFYLDYPSFNLFYYDDSKKEIFLQVGKKYEKSTEKDLKIDGHKFVEMSKNSRKTLFIDHLDIGEWKSLMAILLPVYSEDKFRGYLLVSFDYEQIKKYIRDTVSKYEDVVIINSETGGIVLSELPNFKFNRPTSSMLDQVRNKKSGILSGYLSENKIEKTISYANIDEPKWLIWIEHPMSNYQDEIRRNALKVLVAAIISWLFALGMGLWIAYHQHKFISNFLSSIRAVAKGNYKKKVKAELKLIPREFDSLIEEFNLMEEKIEQLDSFKSNLIDTVSHEFRTPLTSIKGFSSTLLRKDANFDIDTQRKLLKIISDQSDRLSRMVEDLLVVPKLEGNVLKLKLQEIEVEQTIEHISAFFPEESYEINVRGQIWAIVDPDRFEQILLNLFENAHKYSNPKGTKIRVGAYKEGNFAHIVVANASDNVPQEKLTNLFDKFVRLDDKLTRTTGGTGLGLFITKGLVELMQGRIWLESDNNEFRVNFTVPCSDF